MFMLTRGFPWQIKRDGEHPEIRCACLGGFVFVIQGKINTIKKREFLKKMTNR